MIDEQVLDAAPLLRGLNAAARREIARRGGLRRFTPGETLWEAGAPAEALFVVLEGEVRVVRVLGGRQHVLHTEGPGGTLGEVPLFEGGTYPATAVAARRTLCLTVGADGITAAMREDPRLAKELLARLARRVRLLVERLDGQVARSVRARVAAFLLARRQASGAPSFTLGTTQAAVAEELGTVREVVVRTLRALAREGVVRAAGRGRYEVLDVAVLERIGME